MAQPFRSFEQRMLQKIALHKLVEGLDIDNAVKEDEISCIPCTQGKMASKVMKSGTNLSTTPGEVIHTDVCYMSTISKEGERYFVTFTDEATGYLKAWPVALKSEASNKLLEHVKWVERQSRNQVKQIRLDGGTEYSIASTRLQSLGINILVYAPYTPNENGRSERQNRTMLDMIRARLIHG